MEYLFLQKAFGAGSIPACGPLTNKKYSRRALYEEIEKMENINLESKGDTASDSTASQGIHCW